MKTKQKSPMSAKSRFYGVQAVGVWYKNHSPGIILYGGVDDLTRSSVGTLRTCPQIMFFIFIFFTPSLGCRGVYSTLVFSEKNIESV